MRSWARTAPGKSTLMKLIYGVAHPDAGEIRWEGKAVTIKNPAQAREMGIGMVFQHFSLFETLTVVQNVALALPGKFDLAALAKRIEEVSERYGLPGGSPAPRARPLRGRAPAGGDRPLPALGPAPAHPGRAHLRADAPGGPQALRDPAQAGLRGPQHPLHQPQAGRDPGALPHRHGAAGRQGHRHLQARPGDPPDHGPHDDRRGPAGLPPRRRRQPGRGAAEASKACPAPSEDPFGTDLKDIHLEVRSGEIVGIAGVSGNGQQELLRAISGEEPLHSRHRSRSAACPAGRLHSGRRRGLGMCFVPEERLGRGAVPRLTLTENVLLTAHRHGMLMQGPHPVRHGPASSPRTASPAST